MADQPLTGFPFYWQAGVSVPEQLRSGAPGIDFRSEASSPKELAEPFVLWLDELGVSLCQTGRKAMGPIRCDFVGGESRHRRLYGGGKSQTIAKAVGIRDGARPSVVDLTAGMGADGFVLASLGCEVTLVERNPVVAMLLADGLRRARENGELDAEVAEVCARISFFHTSGREWLASLDEHERPDVIYLDPMFPERRKSALVNKTMQAFQQVVGADTDADSLLGRSLEAARYRVVVKRPSTAPWLDQQKPSYALEGKSVRFDIYTLRSLSR